MISAILLCPKTDIGQTEAVNEKSYAVKFDYTIYNKPFLFKFRHSKFSCICWYLPPNPTPPPPPHNKMAENHVFPTFDEIWRFRHLPDKVDGQNFVAS